MTEQWWTILAMIKSVKFQLRYLRNRTRFNICGLVWFNEEVSVIIQTKHWQGFENLKIKSEDIYYQIYRLFNVILKCQFTPHIWLKRCAYLWLFTLMDPVADYRLAIWIYSKWWNGKALLALVSLLYGTNISRHFLDIRNAVSNTTSQLNQ